MVFILARQTNLLSRIRLPFSSFISSFHPAEREGQPTLSFLYLLSTGIGISSSHSHSLSTTSDWFVILENEMKTHLSVSNGIDEI